MGFTSKETNAWITCALLVGIYTGYATDAICAETVGAALALFVNTAMYMAVGLILALGAIRIFHPSRRVDERDHLIAYHAQSKAFYVAMAGLFLSFLTLAIGSDVLAWLGWHGMRPDALAMHLIVLSMVLAELTNQASRIIAYRRSE